MIAADTASFKPNLSHFFAPSPITFGTRRDRRTGQVSSLEANPRERSVVRVDLLRKVVLLADLADDVQMLFQLVGAVLLALEDVLQQLGGAVVTLAAAERDVLV